MVKTSLGYSLFFLNYFAADLISYATGRN